MKRGVSYIELKKAFTKLLPQSIEIENEVLLIDNAELLNSHSEPYRTDCTTTLIYFEGETTFFVNMKEYHAKAPCMVTFLNDQILCTSNSEGDIVCKCIIYSKHFTEALFGNSNSKLQLFHSIHQNPVVELKKSDLHIFDTYFNVLKTIADTPENPYRLEITKHLTLALYYGYTYGLHQENEKGKLSRKEEISKEFVSLLRDNFITHRDISFYADRLCVSAKYLSKVIKETLGKTPSELVYDYVLTESKVLLSSTDMTIQQIAYELNFETLDLFGKFFKRLAGCSPREYRNRLSLG